MRFGRGNWSMLLAPFFGGETKAFLEDVVKEADMPVAGVIGNGPELDVGVGEQLTGPLQAQFILFLTEGHAEFRAKKAAKMPLTAVELRRQVG